MADYDDDEHSAAYERANNDDISTYIDFARIVQHYDDTARPDHDNIDYESGDFDGAEYDDNGDLVTLYGVLLNFFRAFDDATDVDYFNDEYLKDDYDFDDDYDEADSDDTTIIIDFYHFGSFPRQFCKRIRNDFKYGRYFQYPPSF